MSFKYIRRFLSAISYGVMPYRRELGLQHEASFLKQVIEIKEVFLKQKQLMMFLALSCLSYPVLTFLVKLVPIYFYEQGFTANWFAAWKVSFGIGALISGLIIRQLLIKYLPEKLMMACITFIALTLFASSLFSAAWVIVGFALLFGLFNSVNRISRINKMHHEIDLNERGRIEGGLHMFSTFCQSISYILIALLSHYEATQLGFSIASLILLLAAILMLNLYQTDEKIAPASKGT